MDVPHESPEPTFAAPHVLVGKQLGMVVTGKGAAEPNRSLDVLEHVNTAEALAVLKGLAAGAPEARLTLDAKAALDRSAKRQRSER